MSGFQKIKSENFWTGTYPQLLTNAEWVYFLEKMRLYYKPTENQIIQKSDFNKLLFS